MNIQSLVMNLLQKKSNPFFSNLLTLAFNGNVSELEKIAKNMCNQRKVNFDELYKEIKSDPLRFLK